MATRENAALSRADQVSELLLRWQELRQQGRTPSAEELCASHPDLIEELKGQMKALEDMEAVLGIGKDTANSRSTPPLAALDPDATRAETTPSVFPAAAILERWPSVPGYEVLGKLGEGGMGVVYKARHLKLQRLVALKMILLGAGAGSDRLQRFRTEAEAVARLQHPHIVQIYEVETERGQPFLALEYVDGGSLAAQLAKGVLPAQAAAQLLEPLARAMHAAHQLGIVHRDLKPANVLLSADGTAKIGDFGLAKLLDGAPTQTQSGAILGTPSYMAPEQAEGKNRQIGPATDVYSLGAILYEALTGRPPFQGETTLDTLEQVRRREPVPPSRLQPRVPRDLETICLKCLAKEAGKRYASALALADDLRRFLAGESILARPSSVWEQGLKWGRRKPAQAALVAVSVMAVAALLVGWIVFTAKLTAERNRAQNEEQRAVHQERIAKENQKTAEEGWAQASRDRDLAKKEHDLAQAMLNRCRDAVIEHAQATIQSRVSKEREGEPGSIVYVVARSYAVTSASLLNDPELPAGFREKLAESYAVSALQLLEQAWKVRYFRLPQNLNKLKTDKEFQSLRTRSDFTKLIARIAAQP